MRCSSLAQAPKSIRRQRSEQKGRNGFWLLHTMGFSQVGQATVIEGCVGVSGVSVGISGIGNRLRNGRFSTSAISRYNDSVAYPVADKDRRESLNCRQDRLLDECVLLGKFAFE